LTALEVIRRRQLLSQRDLAKKAGVALSTIYLIESGRNPHPRLKVMRALCEALGVLPGDVDEFHAAIEGAPQTREAVAA